MPALNSRASWSPCDLMAGSGWGYTAPTAGSTLSLALGHALHIAGRLEAGYELAHGLMRHLRTGRQVAEPSALLVQVLEHAAMGSAEVRKAGCRQAGDEFVRHAMSGTQKERYEIVLS